MTDGAARRDTPFDDPEARTEAGKLGMRLFLLSLGILFASSLIGYAAIRVLAIGSAVELPALPRGLWASTALLLASSGTMQRALVSVRGGRPPTSWLVATIGLGAAFLAVQVQCWIQWVAPMREALGHSERRFLLTAFYVLTGLHALHVIGGLIPMAVVTCRAWAGRYTAAHHPGVVYVAMYWHFLDAVWLVLFATLMIGS